MAETIGIDDAKISLVRNRALKLYQELVTDDEKAQFRKRVNDSLIILRAFSQGLEIGHTIEMDEANDGRRKEILASDFKYKPAARPKYAPEAKGLAAKVERLGMDFGALMAEVRKGK